MKNKTSFLSCMLFILCAAYAIGTFTFLSPCASAEDGSFMSCHWAGNALRGLSIVLCIQACLSLIARIDALRAGVSLAMVPTALLSAWLPNHVIRLCMMETMRCHTVMRPGAILFGFLIAFLAIAIGLLCKRKA